MQTEQELTKKGISDDPFFSDVAQIRSDLDISAPRPRAGGKEEIPDTVQAQQLSNLTDQQIQNPKNE